MLRNSLRRSGSDSGARHGGVLGRVSGHVIAAAVAVGLVGAAVGIGWWHTARERNEARETLRQVLNPTCVDGSEVVAAITTDRESGRLELAIDRAETALTNRGEPLCSEPRRRIVKVWYTASLETILRPPTSTWFDPQEQTASLQRWQRLSAKAEEYGVDDLDGLAAPDLFHRAHENRLWVLADWAYRDVASDRESNTIPPADRIQFLTEWGVAMRDSPMLTSVEHALIVLRTAVAIGDRYGLDVDETCRFLSQELLRGGDCRGIDADATEPLLGEPNA